MKNQKIKKILIIILSFFVVTPSVWAQGFSHMMECLPQVEENHEITAEKDYITAKKHIKKYYPSLNVEYKDYFVVPGCFQKEGLGTHFKLKDRWSRIVGEIRIERIFDEKITVHFKEGYEPLQRFPRNRMLIMVGLSSLFIFFGIGIKYLKFKKKNPTS